MSFCVAKEAAKLPWCYIFFFLSSCTQTPVDEPSPQQPLSPPEAVVAEESTTVSQPQDAEPVPAEPQPAVDSADKEDAVALTTEAVTGESLGEKPTTELPTENRPENNLVVEYPAAGDGSCAVDGVVFVNGSGIPPANPCQTACRCEAGIVHCMLENCAPPPAHLSRCMPVHHEGVCCPTYACG